MEPDEMTALWRNYDARLDALAQSNALLLRRSSFAATQTVLDRIRRTLWFEIVMDFVVVLLLGAFAAQHVREMPVLAATIMLDIYGIGILASTVAQLVASTVDFDEPVIASAQNVERLRVLRARTAMWTLLLAPLMWPALAIIGARGLLGIEPIAAFGIPWLLENVAFGVAVLVAALFIARVYGTSAKTAPWFARFSESITGKNVRAAADELHALLRYEGRPDSD